MRLIDADKFMDFIKDELKQDRPDNIHIRNIIRVLEDLPSVFDVDKVVEQLEEKSITFETDFTVKENKWNLTKEAIEIVKAGGIDE